ncbi:MAG: hypothetical protein ACR2PC_06065 [Tsuneonella suprasediminis]|uniref:Protein activator of alkane oxidation PraB n=1 Tax=Tsuneonella suprasediminis TaxID=2306996 RepID=A0A419R5J7_9SPHN|nr:hypothetical protein [Tsuneonella suprasediminis]RJX71155.1 hypothetical protein D6858_00490 [Tsuneonella suprasediminis]UBS34393.1 hypothetical protein LBX01_07315 [Altererythrobacter sp. N1]
MMKKFGYLIGAVALCGAQPALADTYTPASTSTFSGTSVKVQKDGAEYTCTLTVNVDATAGSSATATASLSGGFPCGLISVSGTGSVDFDGTYLTISGLTIDPPISLGVCTGPIKTVWGGNSASPRTITLSKPLSNSTATSGADCKMVGTLTQTGGAAVSITP